MEIAEAILLMWSMVMVSPEPVVITYYGTESDGYLGQHHGAYWHGDSCGLPNVVDNIHYGCAAPRWIPYCTEVGICVDGHCVIATVVDRQKYDIIDGYAHVDVWPAVADVLDMVDVGIVVGTMYGY